MQLEFRAVQRIDIFCTGSYNQKQTSEFISACNCSIRHEHQREGGNGIPLVPSKAAHSSSARERIYFDVIRKTSVTGAPASRRSKAGSTP